MNKVRVIVVAMVLGLVAASCASSSAEVEALSPADEVAAGDEVEPTTVEPTTVEPTRVPTATEVPAPTPEPTAESEPTAEVESVVEAALVQCLARSAAGEAELIRVLLLDSAESYEQVNDDQLNKLAANAADCRLVEAALGDDDEADVWVSVDCLNEQLTSGTGGRLLVALSLLGQEQPVPEPLRPSFVDAMDSCLDAEAVADLMITGVEQDPMLAGAADRDCFVDSFEGSDSVRAIWEQLASDPTQPDLALLAAESLGVEAALTCISAGTMVVAAAAEAGVEISEDSIACIDEAVSDINPADFSEEEAGIAMFTCFTEDELAALFDASS